MSECKLTREAYEKLIAENIAAIEASNMPKLEAMHTIDVLRDSANHYYKSAHDDALRERIAELERENAALKQTLNARTRKTCL